MPSASVIAVGLPNAGKSTFIAALGYVLQHNEVPTKLSLLRLSDDLSYLNPMISDWLKCKPFERTKAGVKSILFHLRDGSGSIGDLRFPDISGETFEQHWELREWEPEFTELAEKASGILLFIHPHFLEKPFSVVDKARIAKAAGVDEDAESQSSNVPAGLPATQADQPKEVKGEIWKPRKAASQSKLVDLLQMIARNTMTQLPLRLGIVVSAWDVVEKESRETSPRQWLESSAPLLWQFMTMNPEAFKLRVFGVSAQGGDNKEDGAALLKVEDPSKRINVVGADSGKHDITGPLAWVLKNNG